MSGIPAIGFPGYLDFSGYEGGDQPPYRVIDPGTSNIVAQVTISEDHLDQMIITEHPIEQSAAIADHAYRRPRELRLQVGWSNAYGGSPTYAEQIYNQLVDLQWQRRPFPVYTGKAIYRNMLIAEIRESTTSATEFATLVDIYLREILLVNTQVVPGGVPSNPSQLAAPQVNMPTSSAGPINTRPQPYYTGSPLANATPSPPATAPAIQGGLVSGLSPPSSNIPLLSP